MRDLRTWLTSYAYWNQGGLDNVVSMFLYLAKECFGLEAADAKVGPDRGWVATPDAAARACREWVQCDVKVRCRRAGRLPRSPTCLLPPSLRPGCSLRR